MLENFDWIMEDYLFEFFCHVAVNSCNTVVFFIDYLLQVEVDYFVNLAACRLAVYWSVFQNVHSCPRNVLEFKSHSQKRPLVYSGHVKT